MRAAHGSVVNQIYQKGSAAGCASACGSHVPPLRGYIPCGCFTLGGDFAPLDDF